MSISALKSGDAVNAPFLLKKFEIKSAKNGKNYLDLTVADKTGELSGKLWDVSNLDTAAFADASFARVLGTVETYNGSLQLRVERIAPTIPEEGEIDALVECAPYPPLKMYDKIVSLLSTIENEDLRKIALKLFEEKKDKLLYYPAAKNFHHAVKGGLLYHTYTMFRSALPLLEIYSFLNRDLVYAGIALHDLGKIEEMDSDAYGTVSQYTQEGNLLGHIITTICNIEVAAKELGANPKATLLLKHIILSHHFEAEYGSPKPPMFAEAELVHYLDVLDARMNQFEHTLRLTPAGQFAERVRVLDGRTIFHHGLDEEELSYATDH